MITPRGQRKVRLIEEAGRFALCAQVAVTDDYRYVSVEGPVTEIRPASKQEGYDMAARYMGPDRATTTSTRQALEIADMLIRSGALDILVIDSVAALVPQTRARWLLDIIHRLEATQAPWNKQDHIDAVDLALVQLPAAERGQVLIRTDSGGC